MSATESGDGDIIGCDGDDDGGGESPCDDDGELRGGKATLACERALLGGEGVTVTTPSAAAPVFGLTSAADCGLLPGNSNLGFAVTN
jgi:hypothetical protein